MRTLVVGDVHGCSRELGALLKRVTPDACVLVGDLFTKGPDPVGVWRLIRHWGIDAVLGNHDARLLRAMAGKRPSDAHAHAVIAALDTEPGWRQWLASRPLFHVVPPFTVVHAGLHPSGRLEKTSRSMAISMRRFPMDGGPEAPRWTELYTGKRRVLYGHDAVRGLVRIERLGEPWLIGLDSGCVYGKCLTGYLVEEDQLLHQPAAEVYCPIKQPPSGLRSRELPGA